MIRYGTATLRQHLGMALTLWLTLSLSASASAQLIPGGTDSLFTRGDRPRPLPIEQAFPFFVSIVDDATLDITWQIAPDHYLYRHRFSFLLQTPDNSAQQTLVAELPAGVAKSDPFFGDIEAFYDSVTARLAVDPSLPAGTSLLIEYQGCAEWGFCYPPQVSSYPLVP